MLGLATDGLTQLVYPAARVDTACHSELGRCVGRWWDVVRNRGDPPHIFETIGASWPWEGGGELMSRTEAK